MRNKIEKQLIAYRRCHRQVSSVPDVGRHSESVVYIWIPQGGSMHFASSNLSTGYFSRHLQMA